jgi:serine/threonine protein kinase
LIGLIMNNVVGFTKDRVCPYCQERIGPEDSYQGYCFRCLLAPALDLDDPAKERPNGRLDSYEILTHPDGSFVELGRGSMGITYEAIDTNLQFPVALKVIDFRSAGQEANRDRFLREARAAAKLRHPHVASVFRYGVREKNQCFYAMELVEGETLEERVRRCGPFSIADALEVIGQVARALEAAEQHGLIHRDLKPANLMLLNEPRINTKVIDFGLACFADSEDPSEPISHNGFIGTPAFASPEQLSGKKIDQRSDYFSLGSTLIYLLTGNPPFTPDRIPELAEQIMDQRPVINRLRAAGVPSPVCKLAVMLLSPDPKDRPRNGGALVTAIGECQEACTTGGSKRIGRKTYWMAIVVLSVIIAGTIGLWQREFFNRDSTAKSIAVLPFDNLSPEKDDAYFADGVQDDILTNLAKIADLSVISRASVQGYRNPATRPLPREIGQALHVHYLLNGSIRREEGRIRITAQLVEAENGRQLWAERYDGQFSDIFAIQAELAEAISQQLQAKLSSAEKDSLGDIPTRDLAGYELYLHAKELFANYYETTQGWEPLESAVRLLDEAVARDPNFALAWCTLAKAHDCAYWYNEDHTDSRRSAAENALQKALSLRPDLGEIHLEAGFHLLVTTRDYSAVRRELEIARRTLPNSVTLFDLLADIDSRQGRWLDALNDYQRASTLDPKNLTLILNRFNLYRYHRQYDEFRRIYRETVTTEANAQPIDFVKAGALWDEKGDDSEFHALFDEPAGALRAIGRATLVKIGCALADRNFSEAEKILAADPKQDFKGGERRFLSRDSVLGWIKKSEGDDAGAKAAYARARPQQLAYVQKWPDDPNPLIMLAYADAGSGRKEEALSEARQAAAMEPISRDALEGPTLALDFAEVNLWAGELNSAIKELETLTKVPGGLRYGELAKMPEWDPLRSDPRFQNLLSRLKEPIPIANRSDGQHSKQQ